MIMDYSFYRLYANATSLTTASFKLLAVETRGHTAADATRRNSGKYIENSGSVFDVLAVHEHVMDLNHMIKKADTAIEKSTRT